MNEFINVKPLWAYIQNVLPQVYDDTLGYQELLYKVISKLNELVENNNKLPDYIADLIREYISSGEIEKVLAEVLATYMLNVKFPPAGLEPASGDGSKDDTEAIQGCIDYAQSHGGMAVYFPSGSYLCNSLDIAGKCTMFGYDRYNTRIVLKGGATRPLLNGSVDEFSLNGLGFDGNMDIQVNNVNLIDITVGSGIITNVFVTDGYDLIKAQVDVDLQISDVVFNHAVENGLTVSGSGRVVVDNCVFRTVSALIGKRYVKFGVSNSVISNCVMVGSCPVGVEITGNMNRIQFDKGECVKGFVDSGSGNSVFVDNVEKSEKLIGDAVENVGGDVRVTVQGDATSTVAGNVIDSSMSKTDSVTGKRTVKSGSVDDSTTGARVVKSQSETRTVDDDSIEVVGGDKNVSAKSYHASVNGEFSENVQGNKSDTVVGDVTVDYRNNENITVGGNKTETIRGICQETVEGNKVDDVNGNYERHIIGTLIDTIDSLHTQVMKKGAIKTVTGSDTENVSVDKVINSDGTIKMFSPKYYIDVAIEELAKNVSGFKSVYLKNGDEISIVTSIDESTLNEFITPELFGAVGDGSADDSSALNNAIKWCAANNCELTLRPNSVYGVNSSIVIKDKVSINGNYATIKALSAMTDLIKFDLTDNNRKSHTVSGVVFDCNLMAQNGVTYTRTSRNIFKDCVITNFTNTGFTHLVGYELIMTDVFIIANRTTVGATGLVTGSDSYYTNICLQDCKYAVKVNGSGSNLRNIHAWMYDNSELHENLKGSVFMTITGNSTGSINFISDVYSDTMQYSFKFTQYNVACISNLFVLNGGGSTGFSTTGLNEHAVVFYNPDSVDTRDIKVTSGAMIGIESGYTDFGTNFTGTINRLVQVSNVTGYSWYKTIPINPVDVTVINNGKCYITDTEFNCVCQLTQPKAKWFVGSTLCTISTFELAKFATSDFVNLVAVIGGTFDAPFGVIPLLLNTKTGGVLIKNELPSGFTSANVCVSFEFNRSLLK